MPPRTHHALAWISTFSGGEIAEKRLSLSLSLCLSLPKLEKALPKARSISRAPSLLSLSVSVRPSALRRADARYSIYDTPPARGQTSDATAKETTRSIFDDVARSQQNNIN